MNRMAGRNFNGFSFTVFVSIVLIASIALSGCEPLRKKFTRKKKEQASENIDVPVLEPIEYPKKTYTTQQIYKQHFSVWRGWYQDLVASAADNGSPKRKSYLLGQVIARMEEMRKLVAPERQAGLKEGIDSLRKIQQDVQSPVPINDSSSLKIQLESIEKKIRRDYVFSKIQNNIIKE